MKTAILIMAAGASERFGDCKLLAPYQGKVLLQHAIDKAQQVCPGYVFVVSGAWHEALQAADLSAVRWIHNSAWSQGLGSSIACGMRELAPDYDAVLIMLADQVAVSVFDLQSLLLQGSQDHIVCASYQEQRGVPALFGRCSFFDLLALNGDQGAKKLLYAQRYPVLEQRMPSAAKDIDTPADLPTRTALV